MQKQLKVFYQLHRAHSALFRAADKMLRSEFDLTPTQQAILFLLLEKNAQPITSLAAQLNMGKSSLTGLVDRMSEKGLVRRDSENDDGRIILIRITQKGRDLAENSLGKTKAANRYLLRSFSDEEQHIIARFLNHISDEAETALSQISNERQDHE